MTVASYWAVGATSEGAIDFTPQGMSTHLLQDWLPSVPPMGGHLLMGWPQILTEACDVDGTSFLALKKRAGSTERQWKVFLSWMAGVCGTREVLANEGYEWIAPTSAFYSEAKVGVSYASPPLGFVPVSLSIDSDPNNSSNLRPDYIALKGGTNSDAWASALVEAKGVEWSLRSTTTCPADWAAQVRNAVITYEKIPVQPDRHLVVAVRSAPNMVNSSTRRFQIRAWNADSGRARFGAGAFLDVVTASAYGLCQNLGLAKVAMAISVGNLARRARSAPSADSWRRYARELVRPARDELDDDLPPIQTVVGRFKVALPSDAKAIIEECVTSGAEDRPIEEVAATVTNLRLNASGEGRRRPGLPLRISRVE